MHNSYARRAKWRGYFNICLLVSSIVLFSLFSQGKVEGLQENILYAGTLGNPGKVLKIDLTNLQTIDTMTLNAGENAHALEMTDEYLYVGSVTTPAKIVQIRLSDFARINSYTLPSGFNYAITLHVFSGYLYVALASGQVARMNASTLALIDSAPTPAMARDTVQVGSYLYVSSRGDIGGPSYLQKFRASDLSEVDKINLSQTMAHFMLVIDNYIYIASNAAPAGIMKVDLNTFSEVDSVQFGDSSHGCADVIVRSDDYLYANGDSSPGRVYRTSLSSFTWLDYLDLSEKKACDIEISGKYLFVSMLIEPSVIIKVDLDTFKEVDKLYTGEAAIPQMVVSQSDVSPPPTGSVTVTGEVTDDGTATPISGAYVAIGGYAAVTNQSGVYNIKNLPTGFYTISVNAEGYETKNTTLNASSYGIYTMDFQIRKITVSSTITGTVTKEGTGEPIVGALLMANQYATTTNSTGGYTLVVPPDIYTVRASASEYEESSRTVDSRTAGIYPVNLSLAPIEKDSKPSPSVDWVLIAAVVLATAIIGLVVLLLLGRRAISQRLRSP